jgi:arsenate reductase
MQTWLDWEGQHSEREIYHNGDSSLKPARVLIVCTGNSCRSQMAEALVTLLAGDSVRAFSAGVQPQGYVHPLAIRVMNELGVDMSYARSKSTDEFMEEPLDAVITVCDDAAESCPTFPGVPNILHWPTDDPFKATGDDAARMAEYRRVRDELRQRIEDFLEGNQ